MSSISMDGLILPKQKIIGQDIIGYTMDYVDGISLADVNLTKKELIMVFKKISNLLKYYHKYGIVLSDINVTNILLQSLDEIYFCDVDSCKIMNLDQDSIPFLTHRFLTELGMENLDINENFDRVSLYFLFLYFIFDKKDVFSLSNYTIEKTLERNGLEKQKNFIRYIRKNINSMPYLGDLL